MKLKTPANTDKPWTLLNPASPSAIPPYLASNDLIEAVNLALLLGRPLLLQGEPGSGKTQLAKAVAWNLYSDLPDEGYKKFYREWPINSTTKARDGRYTYDHIQRLRDVQVIGAKLDDPKAQARFDTPMGYIQKGVLWEAFESEQPMVLLIDEIDKADIDFPNDLLLEMDQKYFYVDELAEAGKPHQVKANVNPLIIITSNQERPLPDAFLRRCIYFFIEFPVKEQLQAIVKQHFAVEEASITPALLDAALNEFGTLRQRIAIDKREGGKNISTSELLDWCRVLRYQSVDAEGKQDEGAVQELLARLNKIPFASVLIKNWDDHQRFIANLNNNIG